MTAQHSPDDIDKRIDDADFMKMDIALCDSMGLPFSFRQMVEHGPALLFHDRRQCAVRQNLLNAGERERTIKPALNHDSDLSRVQCAAMHLPLLQSIPSELQTLQFGAQPSQREPDIDQRAEHHVTAHTRKTIEMQPSSHCNSFNLFIASS
jgi:hypothetical protein